MLPEFGCRNVLLLQGPNGPFFRRLAHELRAAGVRVTKVNFHPGDDLYYSGPDVVRYKGKLDAWPDRLRTLLSERGIDGIFLFGDGRPIHLAALAVARERNVPAWVVEEGYLRPDWITVERGGVNGYSRMPRDPEYYRQVAQQLPPAPRPESIGQVFAHAALHTAANAVAVTFFRWALYPNYRHHRSVNAFSHAYCWVRGGLRKLRFARRERPVLDRLTGELSGRYFFVPLQVHCDSQLGHSSYRDITDFIREVVAEFARNASPDDLLVLKHHPADRPYREYGAFLRRLGHEHSLGPRIVYIHDLHLPTVLRHAKGAITMNSTVGLSAIELGVPTKVLGKAVYDMPGLTHRGTLAGFLRNPGVVDMQLFAAYREALLYANQANGSIWKRLPGITTGAGVRWFAGNGAMPDLEMRADRIEP